MADDLQTPALSDHGLSDHALSDHGLKDCLQARAAVHLAALYSPLGQARPHGVPLHAEDWLIILTLTLAFSRRAFGVRGL